MCNAGRPGSYPEGFLLKLKKEKKKKSNLVIWDLRHYDIDHIDDLIYT